MFFVWKRLLLMLRLYFFHYIDPPDERNCAFGSNRPSTSETPRSAVNELHTGVITANSNMRVSSLSLNNCYNIPSYPTASTSTVPPMIPCTPNAYTPVLFQPVLAPQQPGMASVRSLPMVSGTFISSSSSRSIHHNAHIPTTTQRRLSAANAENSLIMNSTDYSRCPALPPAMSSRCIAQVSSTLLPPAAFGAGFHPVPVPPMAHQRLRSDQDQPTPLSNPSVPVPAPAPSVNCSTLSANPVSSVISGSSLNSLALDSTQSRNQRQRIRMQERRAKCEIQLTHFISSYSETPEAKRVRLEREAAARAQRRAAETPEQRGIRRAADAAAQAAATANLTPEARRARQEANTAAQRQRRENMTPAQREQHNQHRRNEYQRRLEVRRDLSRYAAYQDQLPELHSLGLMDQECSHCHALYFTGEFTPSASGTYDRCCNHSRVTVPLFNNYPVLLKELLTRSHPESSNFLDNIRQFNSSLSMASMETQIKSPPGRGPFVFRVHGSIRHNIGPAVSVGNTPSYGQLYFMDSSQAADERIGRRSNSNCAPALMRHLSHHFAQNNALARAYKMMGDIYREEERRARANNTELPLMKMVFFNDKMKDQRRYNAPTANEVAVVFVGQDGSVPSPRQYTVFLHGGGLSRVNVTNEKLDALAYPIFWANGENSWSPNLLKRSNNGQSRTRVTQRDFYCFLLSTRRDFNPILHGGKLMQQLVVDLWVRIEWNELEYLRHNQGQLRGESYQRLQDFIDDGAGGLAGSRIVLPSSHIGSNRHFVQSYQDTMSMVAKYGKPDIFLTFTTNPNWPEITNHLLPGQTPSDRPDIVTRVFNMKWDALLKDIVEGQIFGPVLCHAYTVEFQKRGLPHCHLLVTLASDAKPDTPDKVDKLISAEIPDPLEEPELYEIVKTHMLHRRCGSTDPSAPCMKNGSCSKRFPKDFCDTTAIDASDYPQYRRRNNGRTIAIGSGANAKVYDNRHVVPFCKWILLKYNGHVNIEICSKIYACKYLYKYVFKGCDKATVQIRKEIRAANGGVVDEIEEHIDGRYVCPPEAMHRIFKYDMQGRSHSIDRLQRVQFVPGQELAALNRVPHQKTTLQAYFDLNQRWHEMEESGEDLGPVDPRFLAYTDIPNFFVFQKDSGNYHWKTRTQGGTKKIGRLVGVPVIERERFALRQLLLKVKGPRSFDHLREFGDHQFASFEGAAKARGLLHDSDAFNATMAEATLTEMPYRLRQLFSSLFIFFIPDTEKANEMWNNYKDDMSEDYARDGRRNSLECHALAWYDVSDALSVQNIDFENFVHPPLPQRPPALIQGISVDHDSIGNEMQSHLNNEQSHVVNQILNGNVKLAFLDGPGGCGKTYVYECVYHKLKAQGKSVICAAWTGIASSLLPEGRTISSLFRLNKNDDNKSSSIRPNSKDGQLLREIDVLILDEVSMISSWSFEAIDTCLQDIMNTTAPFGNKCILMGGDFRQVLPIPPKNAGIEPYQICLKTSARYPLFTTFKLTQNMRASSASTEWKEFLLKVGEGQAAEDDDGFIDLPQDIISTGDLIEEIYGGVFDDVEHIKARAILCPLNRRVDVINRDILEMMDSESRIYYSQDTLEKDDDDDEFEVDPEFLHQQTPQGFPLHELRLRVGCVVMLLRNLNIKSGMCNGTRFQVTRFARNYIEAAFINGPRKGVHVLIPRIELISDEKSLSFKFRRRQFPLRLGFCFTINKAQGQSLERVGIDLENQVFGHGQLYVALSRSKTKEGVRIYTTNRIPKAKNVVDRCVIEST